MRTKQEIEEQLNGIQRAFMLMMGSGTPAHARANLFRDLNRRSSELLKERELEGEKA